MSVRLFLGDLYQGQELEKLKRMNEEYMAKRLNEAFAFAARVYLEAKKSQ